MMKLEEWNGKDDYIVNVNETSLLSSDEEDTLSDAGFGVAAACLFLIFLLGSTTNLIVIVVISRNRKLRTPVNIVLLNLSLNDFTISIIGSPMSFISAIYHRWIFGETLCHIYAFMMVLSGMTSIGTLVAIAIERYIIISRPLRGRNVFTPSATVVTLSLIWTYSLVQAIPPLFGWNEYVIEKPGIACSVEWQGTDFNHVSYIAYIFILGYILPVTIMAACYMKIVSIVKNAPRRMSKSSTAKAEYKVTVMAWVMVVCTVTAWTPYATVSFIVALGFPELVGPVASACPAIFAKASVICNPIIYFFLNSQMRDAFLDYFPRLKQRLQQHQQRESTAEYTLETMGKTVIASAVVPVNLLQQEQADAQV